MVSIGSSGQASIDKVAGPVGKALIMTALGLAVAIPATFGYTALVRSNKTMLAQLNKFGFDLHALLCPVCAPVTARVRARSWPRSHKAGHTMAMGTLSDKLDEDLNPEKNTLLVDVMLVLLIIFIITIPVINHSVKLDLPRATTQSHHVKPETVNLTIEGGGKLLWNNCEISETELPQKIADAAQAEPQPEMHLRAERTTQYEKVAQVMAAAQNGGLTKIGFITDPNNK